MADTPDTNLLQWAVGGVAAGTAAAFGWLWTRIGGIETRMDGQIRDLWSAISDDRKTAQESRVRMLERLGDMPTKADLERLETRIVTMLTHRAGSD